MFLLCHELGRNKGIIVERVLVDNAISITAQYVIVKTNCQ